MRWAIAQQCDHVVINMPPRDSTLHYKVTEARSTSLAPFVFNFLAEIYTDRTRVLASACINFMGGVFDGARNLCDGGGVRNLYTSASYVQFPISPTWKGLVPSMTLVFGGG